MQCPSCGESKVKWKTEFWGDRQEQFFAKRKKVLFMCGGKFIYDEANNTYEEIQACKRKK